MKKIVFKPSGVCCREMSFEVDAENKITDIDFVGGCPGNMIGIKHLVLGEDAFAVADKLENIPCGGKATSCPDQLSKAIREAL
ncbi:TIGR03905 family TSCPD domain-containing protein [Romboutsia weinsteinii]|uniref:ribonucleoside-diphosphate reductase n=1 Tax=Romboutsia weinsteinii TaxID=2020949 RepID=A0A371IXB1_9FIRM|nr:TIGR03905 family TSCPD domain-containing protein [Romboutsia weinsteinii]RDY25108.1 TIGR03905 family TSCPD domain-containing protein [Romboutsia weinsteinii]